MCCHKLVLLQMFSSWAPEPPLYPPPYSHSEHPLNTKKHTGVFAFAMFSTAGFLPTFFHSIAHSKQSPCLCFRFEYFQEIIWFINCFQFVEFKNLSKYLFNSDYCVWKLWFRKILFPWMVTARVVNIIITNIFEYLGYWTLLQISSFICCKSNLTLVPSLKE